MRKTFNFFILAITILTMNLLTGFITEYFMHYKGVTNPYKFTAIGMSALIIVFYPFFGFLDEKIKSMTRRLVKGGKNLFGKSLGLFIVIFLLIGILYCVYAHLWFNMNIIKILLNKF